MAEPKRLHILKRLTALIETVSIANGYSYNLAGRVFRGKTVLGEEIDVPCITILEAPRPGFNQFGGEQEVTATKWQLLLQGFAKDDPKHPSDPLYYFADEIANVLSSVVLMKNDGSGRPYSAAWYMLGRDDEGQTLVESFEFGPSVVRPPDGTPTTKVCFYMPVTIGITGEVGRPINAP